LPSPIRAGGYHVVISGYTAAIDAHVSATLLASSGDGGAETILTALDGPPPPPGMGKRTWIDSTYCSASVDGPELILRVKYLSGSTFFSSIITELTTP
jgi:hypothetical protein